MLLYIGCANVNPPNRIFKKDYSGNLPIDRLVLPDGLEVDVYVEGLTNARSMALSPEGTLYVGTRTEGKVYAVRDLDNDQRADTIITLLEDMNMPNGVALRNGDLYIAEVNRVLRIKDVENNLQENAPYDVINDTYPEKKHHGWKYIAFGPDDKLYVPVGAPCNICESDDKIFNSITRIDPNGQNREIVHIGVRNTVGFDWHPETDELYFTDNGRDWMGDESPECELNYAPQDGMDFGYPYCHQGDIVDPKLGDGKSCDDYTAPVQLMGPHTAPLGMEFYKGDMFPEEYKHDALVALHGSWNRSKKSGYNVMRIHFDKDNKAVKSTPFITGWLDDSTDEVWGRPVDVEEMPDGSLLISDDFADAIYRVYKK